MAGRINRISGTNVGPWDIDDIDPQWHAAYLMMSRLDARAKMTAQVQRHFDKAKRDHPTFRKH